MSNANQVTREKKMLMAIKELRLRLESAEAAKREPVAIVGMSCRFPGGANSLEAFWDLLEEGRDGITEVPSDRWDIDAFYDDDADTPGKMNTRYGGFLENVHDFDAAFFGIAPREAISMDPQQRLLLEVSWEALEHAGIAPDRLSGSLTGVYIGMCTTDHFRLVGTATELDAYMATGNMMSPAAGRLSYFYGFKGPSLVVDTACSSSFVALHQAISALRNKECHLALAGGVNLLLLPDMNINLSKAHMLSPKGRCHTFDDKADGYIRSDGCGVVVLKRLRDAQKDGDPVLAIIRGSAINQDGRTSGLTAPNGPSQEEVIRAALAVGSVDAHSISYVEAHGTGTSLGDPIEMGALNRTYGQGREVQDALWVGSVKTNIGHTEAAAGVAALIKVVLALGKQHLPTHLHFEKANPHLGLSRLPVKITSGGMPWSKGENPRRAGISSFGFSGTNTHVIVEEAPSFETTDSDAETDRFPLVLSARSESALSKLATSYANWLDRENVDLSTFCRTANGGRAALAERLFILGKDKEDLQKQLHAYASDGKGQTAHVSPEDPPRVAFCFSGQGSQYAGMGRMLYDTQRVFRETIDQCNAVLEPLLGHSLKSLLFPDDPADPLLDQTTYTQPCLFSLEVALARLWASMGIVPDVVMGHSVGEYAAAVVAGVFSLEEGATLIAQRARLMGALPSGGGMLAVKMDAAEAEALVAQHPNDLSVAAYNGPDSTVIAGTKSILEEMATKIKDEGGKAKLLVVSHAFHSHLMDPMLEQFRGYADAVAYAPPRITFISNLTGKTANKELTDPDYWVRHVREPVRFIDGTQGVIASGSTQLVEVGPAPVLLGMMGVRDLANLPSLRKGRSDARQFYDSLGRLFLAGLPVDWRGLPKGKVAPYALPTYPFERKTYKVTANANDPRLPNRGGSLPDVGGHPMLGKRHRTAMAETNTFFDARISRTQPGFLGDHGILHAIIVPGTAYLEMAASAARQIFGTNGVVVEDAIFPRALNLPEDETVTLQFAYAPDNENEGEYGIYSLADETTGEWVQHSGGRLRRGKDPSPPEPFDVEQWKAEAERTIPGPDFYDYMWSRHYLLGPRFRAVQEVWVHKGAAASFISSPKALLNELDSYSMHPVMLDSCLQTTIAALPGDGNFLPYAVERLYFYQPMGETFYCRARLRDPDNTEAEIWAADLDIFAPDGSVIARIDGFIVKRASSESLQTTRSESWRDWLTEIKWQPSVLSGSGKPSGGIVVVGAHDHGLVAAVGDGPVHRIGGDADFRSTFARLKGDNFPVHHVVYVPESADDSHLVDVATTNCQRLRDLTQCMIAQHQVVPRLWVVTQDAAIATEGDKLTGLAGSACLGFLNAANLELPDLRGTSVDVDSATSASELLKEIAADSAELQVAWRKGTRLAARLEKSRRAAGRSNEALPALAEQATYVITGGLGGLGLALASAMAKAGARHLVLTSRRSPDSVKAEILNPITEQGAAVRVVCADAANEASVFAALAEIRENMPPIRGIVHAAGILDDGMLQQQDTERFARVLAPKIAGGWYLHKHTQQDKLDFFVCFSSIASLLGSQGQTNYASGNAFLDALASRRRADGKPGLSMNWGPWAVAGMAADDKVEDIWERRGVSGIEPDQGTAALLHLCHEPVSQIGIARMTWQRYLNSRPASPFFALLQKDKKQASKADVSVIETLKSAPAHQQRDQLETYLHSAVSQVLALDEGSALDGKLGFFDMGMDSLTSLELRNRLQRDLEINLPTTLAFDYGTVDALFGYLADELFGATEEEEETVAPVVAPEEPSAADEVPDDLDEAKLAELLAEELGDLMEGDD